MISVLLGAAIATTIAAPADAEPRAPKFGPAIDDYPSYDGARRCDPSAKPGVVAFRNLILRAYPATGAGGIGRACSSGGTSEHHEGRAWDWGVNVSNASERRAANEVIDWLIRKDRFGNRSAMARRLGVMYIIWNRRIWMPYSGWRTYCVQRRRTCKDPDDGSARHPHTDHVHFSFTWAGARKQTTFWKRGRSKVSGIAGHPSGDGHWLVGKNGGVAAFGAGYHGSRASKFDDSSAVAVESTPTGGGYWTVTSDGRVTAFGDARRLKSARGRRVRIVDIAATPSGRGYWLLGHGGQVFPYGDARPRGAPSGTSGAVGMAVTPTGKGYWIATARGRVMAFGDAERLGTPEGAAGIVGIATTPTGRGYWVATSDGKVFAFGDAPQLGGGRARPSSAVTGIAATGTGRGFWLATEMGQAVAYGDAR